MISAVAFLTVIGRGRTPDASTFRWFAFVGAAIGAVLGGLWWVLEDATSPLVAAGVIVAADLAITGMLHLDGLADSADGLLPHLPRERRLEVMRAPDVGAFAVTIVPTVLLLRWAALASQPVEPGVLVGLWSMSRALLATVPAWVPYARADGLASPFLSGSHRSLALGVLPGAAVIVAVEPAAGAVAVAAALVAGVGVVALARRRLGGFTGDVLGAALVVTESVGLLVLTETV
ncbi:MAG: adenosylcobinamide-GDP ribazoletransferase [Actinomycetota bacterium]